MPQPPLRTVQRIDLPTRSEFFKRWLPLGEPLILTGAVSNWRASREWSVEAFKNSLGHTLIWVEQGPLFEFEKEHLSLAEYIERSIEADPPETMYWSGARVFQLWPMLAEHIDLDRPDLFNQALMALPRMYIGPIGSFSPIHFDHAPNFTAQIVGRKRWVFYAPDQTDLLYRYPWHHFLGHFSTINTREKLDDFDRFPLFERAQAWEAVVEPGDIIYVPPKWWHHVSSLDPTISLHFFWKTWPQYALQVVRRPLWNALGKSQQSDAILDWRKIGWIRQLRAIGGHHDGLQGREIAEIGEKASRLVARTRKQ